MNDESITDKNVKDKIHNYFLQRKQQNKEGGLLAYTTTDGFLNSPSNKEAELFVS